MSHRLIQLPVSWVDTNSMDKLKLVAHRGYATKYPENSMEALEAAICLGAKYIEMDIQLSADFVPVIVHDENLQRCSGVDISVLNTPWEDLKHYSVGEPERFGDEFTACKLAPLSSLVSLLQVHPDACAFVEIKEESLAKFGTDFTVARILDVLADVLDQCVIISFDAAAVATARQLRGVKVGWVMHSHDEDSRGCAEQLKPDMLICNYTKITDLGTGVWQGPWQWFVYEVVDADLALHLHQAGISFIESMDVGALLEDGRLS